MSDKALYNLIKVIINAILSSLAKINQSLFTSHLINFKKIKTNDIKKYSFIRITVGELKINHVILLNYINKNKLFKDKYIINKVN